MRIRKLLLTAILTLIIVSQLLAAVDVDAARRTEFVLSLEAIAPKLPADGGKYYAILQLQTGDNRPVQAPFDMDIDISSSDPSVISVPPKVTIKEGQTYVKVDLITTKKASDVRISALGAGAKSSEAVIKTVRPEGLEPTQLAVYSAPQTMLPDQKFVGKVYVQLLNAQKLPAAAKSPITVRLTSEDIDVGQVPNTVVIDEGTTGKLVDFTVGRKVGSTRVTASASGLASGSVVVKTAGFVGEKIALYVSPSIIPAQKGAVAIATVQLLDGNGFPVNPPASIMVFLKSSNSTIVQVEETIVIGPGRSYASIEIEAGGAVGKAEISASASGYASGFAEITASPPATEGKKLVLYVSPAVLPPDNSLHEAIVIQIQDDKKQPYTPRSGELELRLTSSNIIVGTVDEEVDFDRNRHFTLAKFKTRFVVGETTITLSQTGYTAAQIELNVKGPEASFLTVSQIPPLMEADGQIHDAIVVELLAGTNKPVPAPTDIRVELSSSVNDVANIDPVVTIPEGKSFAIARVRTTDESGTTTITASAQGVNSGSVEFKTLDPLTQRKLAIYAVPERLLADGDTYEAVVVQLQDKAGNPATAQSDIVISLSESSMTAGSIERSVVIPAGSTYATAKFTTSTTTDRFKVTASAPGYDSVTDDMETFLQPLFVTTSPIPRRLTDMASFPIQVSVLSGEIPIKGAMVEVSGTGVDLRSAITDEDGNAEVLFVPTAGGTNKVELTVTKKGYSPVTRTVNLSVTHEMDVTIRTVTEGGREIDAKIVIQPPVGRTITQETKVNKPIILKDVKLGTYTITIPEEIRKEDGRYKFERWSDGVTDNPRQVNIAFGSELTAVYSASYLLLASTPYGTISGIGWYPEGSKVTLSIAPTSVSEFIIDRHFAGWSGDVKSDVAAVNVVMNSPKSVTAEWNDDYTKLIGIAGGGAGAAGFFFYRRFKENRFGRKEKPPDLDWYKSD